MTDDIRTLLGQAVADEPPLRFSREDVVAQGRRIRRRRVLTAAGGAVAGVAAVAAAVVIVSGFARSPARVDEPARPQQTCATSVFQDSSGGSFAGTVCERH
ncbi:hypothetical protein [Actinocrispum sp. NPDC049592]|uniref:hypothetical protein n=1 Tax=Actinocrispum sp. NPDC049592 TaxID=3154835 RepID=UPI0034395DCC